VGLSPSRLVPARGAATRAAPIQESRDYVSL
jgi:hypothetical protein